MLFLWYPCKFHILTPPPPPPPHPCLVFSGISQYSSNYFNVQGELSKLNFNFDGIRTYFLQVLRQCQQITFVRLNDSKKFLKLWHNQFYFLLFLLAFTGRYHFSQVFRTSFNNIWKKDFRHKFSFLRDSLTPKPQPHPLNSLNMRSVTKVFCQCSVTYHGFLISLCYDDARKN